MAEQKPSATARAHRRIRRSATRTGVTQIRHHQPDRYTIIGNHLAQHRELSLTAIGVGTHILSLPEGTSVDIRTLAARFPEGRDRIAFALRELEAQGYIERVRERTPGGRVVTRTYACNDPAADRARAGGDGAGADDGAAAPPPRTPRSATPVPPASAAGAPVPPEPGEAPRTPHHGTAVALLTALRRADDRLTLPERDVHRLAPALAVWLERGAGPAAVHRTLTANLPPDLAHPAGLLAHRLRELLPPPLPAGSGAWSGPEAAESPPRPRPHPLRTCDGCERAFRAREPGLCRDCRDCRDSRGDPVAAGGDGAAA
ncbi:helix-turn-helix domain-containing protein [Streptomyces lydicus]|uniref:helix-turn-helix domain-containing protein n=1 Tax=Streptomyces lydicus TaxID=47763 RepID=UPI00341F5895